MRPSVHAAVLATAIGLGSFARAAHGQTTPPRPQDNTAASSGAQTPPPPGTSAPASTPPATSAIGANIATPSGPTQPGSNAGRALRHYERAQTLYGTGQYRAAAAELEHAVVLDPAGYNLYFDLGLVYERLGQIDRAIGAYRRYYARVTDAAERERTDRIVTRLQGARSELRAIRARPGRADAWFWGFTISALTSLTVGGVTLFAALREDDHVAQLRMQGAGPMQLDAARSSADTLHLVADIGLVGSVALAATSVVLYLTRDAEPRAQPGYSVALAPAGASFTLHF